MLHQGNFPGSAKKRWLDCFFRQIPGKETSPVPIPGIEFPFSGTIKESHSLNGDLIDPAAGILGRINECFDLTDTAGSPTLGKHADFWSTAEPEILLLLWFPGNVVSGIRPELFRGT